VGTAIGRLHGRSATFTPAGGWCCHCGCRAREGSTKETYRALKTAVTSLFGWRVERAIEKIEASPDDEAAKLALGQTLPAVDQQDAEEISNKVTALLRALQNDPAAASVVNTVARIRLDVDAGGHVLLEDIRGARQIDVRASAAGDFAMRGVDMDPGKPRGNS
jgi:hypothetical protein